jgi:hypothetical protein
MQGRGSVSDGGLRGLLPFPSVLHGPGYADRPANVRMRGRGHRWIAANIAKLDKLR